MGYLREALLSVSSSWSRRIAQGIVDAFLFAWRAKRPVYGGHQQIGQPKINTEELKSELRRVSAAAAAAARDWARDEYILNI
eukprot:1745367-Amphidinium_carterae.1